MNQTQFSRPAPSRVVRPGCLISVRDAAEATRVLGAAAAVAILDLKEPNNGPLGRADAETMDRFLAAVGQDQPTSVALGELNERGTREAAAGLDARFHFAKIGLAGAIEIPDWQTQWRETLSLLPPNVVRVAVAYLDHERCQAPGPREVVAAAVAAKCGVVLFDTFDKSAGSFAHAIAPNALADALGIVRQLGLRSVLAGSIRPESLAAAIQLGPDLIGVRGAVCDNDRCGHVSTAHVKGFLQGLEKWVLRAPSR